MHQDYSYITKKLADLGKKLTPKKSVISQGQLKAKVFERIHNEQKQFSRSFFGVFFKKAFSLGIAAVIILPSLSFFVLVGLQKTEAAYVGQLYILSGSATVVRARQHLQVNQAIGILEGDDIHVPEGSTAELRFIDHTKTFISEDTSLTVKEVTTPEEKPNEVPMKLLTLHKGEVREEKVLQDSAYAKNRTHIETPTGVVRANNDAGFIVTLDKNQKNTTVIVTDKSADVVDVSSISSSTQEHSTSRLALLAGEMGSFHTATDTQTNQLITQGAKINPISFEGGQTLKEKILAITNHKLPKDILLTKKSVETPQTLTLDFLESSTINDLLSASEIAQVKLIAIAEGLQNNNSETEVMNSLKSYEGTLNHMRTVLVPGISDTAENLTVKTIGDQNKVDDLSSVLAKSQLTNLVHTLSAKKSDLSTVEQAKVHELEQQLMLLYSLESTVSERVREKEDTQISQKVDKITTDNELFDALSGLEQKATAEHKKKLRSALSVAAKKRLSAVLTIADEKTRDEQLVKYLNGFNASLDTYKLVEELKGSAGEKYKGYFAMRLHRMKYNEGVTGSGSQMK